MLRKLPQSGPSAITPLQAIYIIPLFPSYWMKTGYITISHSAYKSLRISLSLSPYIYQFQPMLNKPSIYPYIQDQCRKYIKMKV